MHPIFRPSRWGTCRRSSWTPPFYPFLFKQRGKWTRSWRLIETSRRSKWGCWCSPFEPMTSWSSSRSPLRQFSPRSYEPSTRGALRGNLLNNSLRTISISPSTFSKDLTKAIVPSAFRTMFYQCVGDRYSDEQHLRTKDIRQYLSGMFHKGKLQYIYIL